MVLNTINELFIFSNLKNSNVLKTTQICFHMKDIIFEVIWIIKTEVIRKRRKQEKEKKIDMRDPHVS